MNNRTFKFRIWSKSKHQWVEDSIEFSHYINQIFDCDSDYVIQQFAGLKDKKGKEIYEGDIVKYSISDTQHSTGEVKWNEKHCYFYFNGKWNGVPDTSFYKPEVIGNIFENPNFFENNS